MHLLWLILLSALVSCSGYRFKSSTNPFENYGVRKIAIPIFLNQSPVPNTAAPFTKEITLLLSQYPGLEIVGADTGHADAVLVGVIDSKDKLSETVKTNGYKITNSVAPKSLAGRSDFFVPFSTSVNLSVRLILIKDPAKEDVQLAQSELADQLRNNPKILFNEILPASGSFNREIYDEAGGQANFSQNKGAYDRTIKTMATNLSNNFKEMILYAF